MTDKRKTIWYVEINHGATNEAAMEYLSKTCDATQDKFVRIKDRGGTSHHLLQVERGFINLFERNQKKFNLFFTVYRKHERDTYVDIWEFPRGGKIHRTKKFKEMEERLKNIRSRKKK